MAGSVWVVPGLPFERREGRNPTRRPREATRNGRPAGQPRVAPEARTIMTEHGAWCATCSLTLPSSRPAHPADAPVTDHDEVDLVALGHAHEGALGTTHRHLADRLDAEARHGLHGGLELRRALVVGTERPLLVSPSEDRDDVHQSELGVGGPATPAAASAVSTDASDPSIAHAMCRGNAGPAGRAIRTEHVASRRIVPPRGRTGSRRRAGPSPARRTGGRRRRVRPPRRVSSASPARIRVSGSTPAARAAALAASRARSASPSSYGRSSIT